MTALRSRARVAAGSLGTALVGQTASFGAVLAPILGHRIEAVAMLVTVSAAGNIVSAVGSWSFASVYPAVRTGVAARPAIATATAAAVTLAAGLLVAAGATTAALPALATALWLIALFATCQTAYFITLGFCIRHQAVRRIGHLRLAYGVTNLALALAATVPAVPDIGLSVGTSLAFLVAALLVPLGSPRIRRVLVASVLSPSPSTTLRYAKEHWRAALAGFFTNVGLQASALIVLGLPLFRGAWAVVLRIGGGFGTIGVSILGPRVQVEVARASRRADARAAAAANVAGVIAGSVLALLSLSVSGAVLLYSGVLEEMSPTELAVLLTAVVLFVGTSTAISPLVANLVLLGHQRINLALNVARVVVLVPAVLLPSSIGKLLVLVIAESIVQIAYAVACFRAARRVGRVDAEPDRVQSSTAIGSSGVM